MEIYEYEPVRVDNLKQFVKATKKNRDYINIQVVNNGYAPGCLLLQGYETQTFKSGKETITRKQLTECIIDGSLNVFPYDGPKINTLSVAWDSRNIYTLLAHRFDRLDIDYYPKNNSINMDNAGLINESVNFKALRVNKRGNPRYNLLHEIQINQVHHRDVNRHYWGRYVKES